MVDFRSITLDPGSMPGGVRGQNLVHLQNVGFLRQSFPEVQTLTTTYKKAFLLGPYVACKVCYKSMTSDPRVELEVKMYGGPRGRVGKVAEFQRS